MSLTSIVGILFQSLVASSMKYEDVCSYINFKQLDTLLQNMLSSGINDIKKSTQKSSSLVDTTERQYDLYSFDLFRVIIMSLSREFYDDSNSSESYPSQHSALLRTKSTVLIFMPFLLKLLKEMVGVYRQYSNLNPTTKSAPVSYTHLTLPTILLV